MTSRNSFSVHLIGLCVNWREYGRVHDFRTHHQSHGKSLFLLKFDVRLIGINIPASVSIVDVVAVAISAENFANELPKHRHACTVHSAHALTDEVDFLRTRNSSIRRELTASA